MSKKSVRTSITPEVIIEPITGNLKIRGWEKQEVLVSSSDNELLLDENEDVVRVGCRGNCSIRLPHGSEVKVQKVDGNASINYLDDVITLEDVSGSLALRSVASITVNKVAGNLSAKGIDGDLTVDNTTGNATIREVHGKCALKEVKGNVLVREVEAGVSARVSGNAHISLGIMLGDFYEIIAGGNIKCRLPEFADVGLDLISDSEDIRIKHPDNTKTSHQEKHFNLTMGSGDAEMRLHSGGNLLISFHQLELGDEDMFVTPSADLSQHITDMVDAQIESQMQAMTIQLDEHLAGISEKIKRSGFDEEQTAKILQEAEKTREREAARAEENMKHARERLERNLQTAQQRQRRKIQAADRRVRKPYQQTWRPDALMQEPAPEADAVSKEEQLMIMQMLAEKKISVEDADQLLEALEGKAK